MTMNPGSILVAVMSAIVLVNCCNHSQASLSLPQEQEEAGKEQQKSRAENHPSPSENDEPTWQEKIKFNSDLVVKTFKDQMDIDLTYDRAGVEAVSGFIDRNRQTWIDAGTTEGLVNNLGAFIGECLVNECGGEWVRDEEAGSPGVKLPREIVAFPFNKTRKHINKGAEESVFSLYSGIQMLIKAKEANPDK